MRVKIIKTPDTFGQGGSIHIDPSNKGKFTESARHAGMGVQEYASHILANKDDYSSTQVKRANFAKNASKWHSEGGNLFKFGGIEEDEIPFDFAEGYVANKPVETNAVNLLVSRGMTVDEAIDQLNDIELMDRLYQEYLDRMSGKNLPENPPELVEPKQFGPVEGLIYATKQSINAKKNEKNYDELKISKEHANFLDFLNNIPQRDLRISYVTPTYTRQQDNNSLTADQSMIQEDKMNNQILNRGHNDYYYIPYSDYELVEGVPSNVLDSLSKYAGLTGTPIEEGIGLAGQETRFGRIPFYNFKNGDPEYNRALGNSNYIKNYGGIPAEYLIRNFQYNGSGKGNENAVPKDELVPPLLDGFQYYNSGNYNTNSPSHQEDVRRVGLEFLNTAEGQDYWNRTGQYWYNGIYRNAGDDDQKIFYTPYPKVGRQTGDYPLYNGGLHSDGGNLFAYTGDMNDDSLGNYTVVQDSKNNI